MLSHLFIQNYALISHLEVDFDSGFTVITGETGAGKSILLGALNLILGKRADTSVLLDKSKKCIVEGVFNISQYNLQEFFTGNDLDYDDNSIFRREVNDNGKSRAFINDTPVKLTLLKELGEKLVDIHSQTQTLSFNNVAFQLAVIDNYAGLGEEVNKYRQKFNKYIRNKKDLENLIEEEKRLKSDKDYFRFLHNEINEAQLRVGEQEELEKELEISDNAEEIKTKLFAASQFLGNDESNILNQLSDIRGKLNQISKFSDSINDVSQRIESTFIELSDILAEIEQLSESISHNPERSQEIRERLDLIYNLQNKHRVNTIEEMLSIVDKLVSKLNNIDSLQDKIKSLETEVKKSEKAISKLSLDISKKRRQVFAEIINQIIVNLVHLGMPYSRFQIKHTFLEQPCRDGIDSVKFLFNANRGGELQELSKVASGGETSRLLLAVKSIISQKNLLPTVIFDEIDKGVSGEIADKVGNILVKLGSMMQVIAITHLPQIAGKGDAHYFVYKKTEKETTKTIIKILNSKDRVNEIAKMLSGQIVTSASVETARHLLKS